MTALNEQTEVPLARQYVAAADLPNSESPIEPPSEGLSPTDLAELVARHQADVWRYLRYLGADAADADDLTQETFLALSRSNFEQRSDRKTAAYLRTVARNQLLMFRRFQGRAIDTVQLEAAEQVWAGTVSEEGLPGILALLTECLKTLDGRAREAIHLCYREDLSRKAMASALSMRPEGIKTLLRRTRDALRDCIERKTKSQT
ncbi:MAG: sigma-70 family RNA polymerase sigma factor [Planctomycetota bacterium]